MKSHAKLKYDIFSTDHIEVMADVSLLQKTDDVFFNATLIAKQFGKKPIEWLDSKQGKEYITVILEVENLHSANLVRTTIGGKYQGTWLHNKMDKLQAQNTSLIELGFDYEARKDLLQNRRTSFIVAVR